MVATGSVFHMRLWIDWCYQRWSNLACGLAQFCLANQFLRKMSKRGKPLITDVINHQVDGSCWCVRVCVCARLCAIKFDVVACLTYTIWSVLFLAWHTTLPNLLPLMSVVTQSMFLKSQTLYTCKRVMRIPQLTVHWSPPLTIFYDFRWGTSHWWQVSRNREIIFS